MSKTSGIGSRFFLSVYSVLLLAYPREFREEYGSQMVQLLRDCQRNARIRFAVTRLWLRAFVDLVRTVPGEHLQNMQKENHAMSKTRTDLVAIGGCILLIVSAMLLLNYGRSHQVASILLFGYVLDAIVFTGIVGNLIVFLLGKFRGVTSLPVVFWTFLAVSAIPAFALTLIGPRLDPNFNAPNVLIGYAASFLFWYGLHWLWTQKARSSPTA